MLDNFDKIADQDADKYEQFYREFGITLREGIASDFENRERIARLMRFPSTKTEVGKLTSLDDYLERAGDGQSQIYFLTGTDADSMRRNPNLEIFSKKDIEVLLLTDPVDEIMFSNLQKYKDKQLLSVDAADVDLPKSDAKEDSSEDEDAAETGEPESGFGKVLVLFKEALGDRVVDVRESKRLTDSPCCLVNPDGTMSAQLQRALQITREDFEMAKRVFEINPHAPLIRRLCQLSSNTDHDAFIRDCGVQLFTNAMLLDGMAVEPQGTVARTQQFMNELAEKRSPIVT